MANNTGATCLRCGKGRYKVFDLNDDIFGDLRCDICRHHVKLNQDLMAEPTPLSPAAEAVMDAAHDVIPDTSAGEVRAIAAALRAAADTLVANEFWDKYPAIYYRKKLLAIANELEGAN